MKVGLSLRLFVFLILFFVNSFAQEITFTTTKVNLFTSKATIDLLALSSNPLANIVAARQCECADQMELKNRLIQAQAALKEYQKQLINNGPREYSSDNYKNLEAAIDASRKSVRLPRFENDYEASIDSTTCEVSKYYQVRRNERIVKPRLMNGCLLNSLESKMNVSKKSCEAWKLSGGDGSDYREGKTMAEVIQELIFGYAAEIRFIKEELAALKCQDEPCDGQWVGTVTYLETKTDNTKTIIEPSPNNGFQISAGGYDSSNNTVTLKSTITVNSKDGHNSVTNSTVEENSILDHFISGKVLCSPKRGWQAFSLRRTQTNTGSGNSQDTTSVYLNLDKDFYTISISPFTIRGTLRTSVTYSESGSCSGGNRPPDNSPPSIFEWHGSADIKAKYSYDADKNILFGTYSKTKDYGNDNKVVSNITWDLRKCNK